MPSPPATAGVDRARWAATAAFFTNGALLGALIPHYPGAKAAFGLDSGAFGLLVITLALGAAAAGSTPAPLLRRCGSRRVVLLGSLLVAALALIAGLVIDVAAAARADGDMGVTGSAWPGAVWLFAAGLFVAGAADAAVDTAQNAQGLRVQSLLGRPVLTSMHAGWSLGAAAGAGLGALSIALGLPVAVHLGLNGLACAVILALAVGRFVPDDVGPHPTSDSASPSGTPAADASAFPTTGLRAAGAPLLLVSVIAMGGFAVEEFGNSWTSLYLQSERGLDAALAGLGAATLLLAQFAGRVGGDAVLHALGRRRTLTASLAVVVVGLVLALGAPATPLVSAGLALAGVGCAVVVPTAYALGDEIPGLPRQTGLAVVSWLMRLASIGLSPLVGLLAVGLPLTAALAAFPALAALGLVCSLLIERPARPRTGAPTPAAR